MQSREDNFIQANDLGILPRMFLDKINRCSRLMKPVSALLLKVDPTMEGQTHHWVEIETVQTTNSSAKYGSSEVCQYRGVIVLK